MGAPGTEGYPMTEGCPISRVFFAREVGFVPQQGSAADHAARIFIFKTRHSFSRTNPASP